MAKEFTAKDLKKMVMILRRARFMLRRKQQEWICFAISSAVDKERARNSLLEWQNQCDIYDNYLCDWIYGAMNPKGKYGIPIVYYHKWIERYHTKMLMSEDDDTDDVVLVLTEDYISEACRPGRIAWTTWMIDQLEQEIATLQ